MKKTLLLSSILAAFLSSGCGLEVQVRLHDPGFTEQALAAGGLAVVAVTVAYPPDEDAPAANGVTGKQFRRLLTLAHRNARITDAAPLKKSLGKKGFARLRQMASEKTRLAADASLALSVLPAGVPVFMAWVSVTFSKTRNTPQRKRIYAGISEDRHSLYAYQTTLTASRSVWAHLKIYDRTRGMLVWAGDVKHKETRHAAYVEPDDLLEQNERRQRGERFAWPEPPSRSEMAENVFNALVKAF